jgi:quercetin dioxygenase-like cupin family protein
MGMEPIRPETVLQQAPSWSAGDVAFWMLGAQGAKSLWLGRFGTGAVGQRSPWERHPEGEELLHVLEGAVEVTLLLDSGPVSRRLDAGSIFVVPRGVWHAHTALAATVEFGATPDQSHSEHSTAADPRAL